MGMYTEIIFGAGLKEDTPAAVISVIRKMAEGIELDENEVPPHDFFKTGSARWFMNAGGSYYFPGTVKPKFWQDNTNRIWYLHFRTNLKNYNSEIEKFLYWIKHYLAEGSGTGGFYAIVTYEGSRVPTIYFLDDAVEDEREDG